MAQNELNSFFADDPTVQSSICARCGKTAEIHLALLGGVSHHGETVCLTCGEAMLHDLRKQYAEQSALLPAFVSPGLAHKSLDDVENGIIYWEGHGWSSDGPFAGA